MLQIIKPTIARIMIPTKAVPKTDPIRHLLKYSLIPFYFLLEALSGGRFFRPDKPECCAWLKYTLYSYIMAYFALAAFFKFTFSVLLSLYGLNNRYIKPITNRIAMTVPTPNAPSVINVPIWKIQSETTYARTV